MINYRGFEGSSGDEGGGRGGQLRHELLAVKGAAEVLRAAGSVVEHLQLEVGSVPACERGERRESALGAGWCCG